jgi:hypothetical protein
MKTIAAKPSFAVWLIYAVIALGFVLSLAQFIYNRSLWMDEAALALDIIHDSSAMLLKGLANGQVAPILYLQIEHVFALLLPKSEYGLRLFPLLCYWASLILFYKVLRQLFQNNFIILFALSLYVFDGAFIYYASEVKQYMTDVMVVNALLFFALKPYRNERNRYITLTIAGALAIFLSNISAVMLACIGLYMIAHYARRRQGIWYLSGAFLCWAVVFVVYYSCFIYNHPLKQLMLDYWIKAGGFMPLNQNLFAWVGGKFIANFYFQFWFGKITCIVLVVLFFVGMVHIVWKRLPLGLLLLLPMPLHLLLSGFKLYPFDTRLVLYLTPLLIIAITYGVYWLLSSFNLDGKKPLAIAAQLLVPALCCTLLVIQSFPLIRHDDLRRCISFMKSHATPKDDIYVTSSAKYQLLFYHDISYYSARQIILGKYSPSVSTSGPLDSRQMNSELAKPLSNRVWVYCLKPYHEDAFINQYLTSYGYRLSETFTASGNASVCLYTISDDKYYPPKPVMGRAIVKR